MLTSKQRAKLRGIASTEDTIFQIGKGGIPDTLVNQVEDALRVREIVKIKVLENSSYNPKEASLELSEKTNSEVVQVIGSKFVLYKRNPKEPVIQL
jgi:RNA-binding protein